MSDDRNVKQRRTDAAKAAWPMPPHPAEADYLPESPDVSSMNASWHEALLETVLGNVQACIAVMAGPDLRFMLANRAYQALRPGVPMIGRPFREIFPEASSLGVADLIGESLRTGTSRTEYGRPIPAPDVPDAAWDYHIVPLPRVDGETPAVLVAIWDVTEHHRARQALQDREERLKLAKAAAKLGNFDYDLRTDEIEWDSRVRELWGVGPDETITYDTFISGVHPDDQHRMQAAMARALDPSGDGRYYAEYRVINPNDELIRWIAATGQAFHEQGRPVRLIGTVQDITERRWAERALRESEERFRVLVQAAAKAVWQADRNGVTIKDSPSWRAYTGQPLEQWLGESWVAAVHPDQREEARDIWREAVAKGTAVDAEFRLRRPDGEWQWANVRAAPICDTDGTIVKWVGMVLDISEHKQTEEALAASEKKHRELIETASSVIIRWGGQGEIHFINEYGARFLGYEPQELIGRSVDVLVPDVDSNGCGMSNLVQDILDHPDRYEHNTNENVRKDGTRVWVNWTNRATVNEDGSYEILAIGNDITPLKQAEMELRRSEEQAQWVARFPDENLNPVVRLSGEGIVLYSNPAAWQDPSWGCRVGQPPSHDSLRELVEKALTQGKAFTQEVELEGVWFSVAVAPVMAEGYVNLYAHDITERREAEQALRESEERLRLAWKAAELGVFEWDVPSGIVQWNNERMYGLFGRTRQQGPISSEDFLRDVLHVEDRAALDELMARQDGGTFHSVCRIQRENDGRTRWLELSGSFDTDADGRPRRLVGVAADITDRKKSEIELQHTRDELEQRVDERTAALRETIRRLETEVSRRELAEEVIRQRSEKLREMNRELEHRTRQLQALTLQLSVAEDRERHRLSELLHDDLQQILVGARFQLDILARRVEVGKATPEMFSHISSLLAHAVRRSRDLSHELYPPALCQHGLIAALRWLVDDMKSQQGLIVELSAEDDAEPSSTKLKPFLFKAVREMLFNVVKHAGVRDSTVELARSGAWIQATVVDSGKGFDPKTMEDDMTTPGLGLLSIRERAEFLGGSLEIESSDGCGSRFVLRVPDEVPLLQEDNALGDILPAGAATLDDVQKETHAAAMPATADLRILRVLLADDHRVVREGLATLLEEEPDLEVVGKADDGRQAVELARQLHPDVIIMDVSMPELNGIDATRAIKSDQPDVRVIGLSMHEQTDFDRAMRDAGADWFLSKSGPVEELLSAIRGSLSG